jgi:transmembrane sensor
MNDFPQKQLLINYLLGICTNREQKEVEHWLDKEPGNVALLQQVASELEGEEAYSKPDKGEVKQELFRHIAEPVPVEKKGSGFVISTRLSKISVSRRKIMYFKVAAMLLVICLAGATAFYMSMDIPAESSQEIVVNQRSLSYGQTATLRFGDGSVIQLNGGSTLQYPDTFTEDRREVHLDGEAYFRIAEDQQRPFIVHAGNTTTEVLGTSFNIKAYNDENELQIAVAEGKVKIRQINEELSKTGEAFHEERSFEYNDSAVILEKNQWVTYHSVSGILEQGEGNIREMFAWKDRVLLFSNKSFEEVAKMLERWYGIMISIEDESLKDHILEGEHQDVSLEEVLESIRFVMDFEYEIDENEVRIY